jgi:hypothetical protein
MSEMVERVTMAIAKASGEKPVFAYRFEEMARAAIEAMREPTPEMWDACEKARADFETGIGWPVMIDAALAKEPAPV